MRAPGYRGPSTAVATSPECRCDTEGGSCRKMRDGSQHSGTQRGRRPRSGRMSTRLSACLRGGHRITCTSAAPFPPPDLRSSYAYSYGRFAPLSTRWDDTSWDREACTGRGYAEAMKTLSLRLVLFLVSALPRRARERAIRWLAWLRYRRYYTGNRPQAANLRDRLSISPEDAERILQRWYELELLGILDGNRLRSLTAGKVGALVDFRGLDRLDRTLEGGRGAVLTTGHEDGLTLFFAALGVLGYRPNLLRVRTREHKRRLARWWYERYNRQLDGCGCTTLWMEPGSFAVGVKALNALRRNEIVASPVDLSQSDDNTVVEFLGVPATFPRGLALLAQAAGAPLVDFFVHRDAGDRLVAEIGEPYSVTDVDTAVQHSAARLEEYVRRHPADWSPWHVFDEWRTLRTPAASPPAEPSSPAGTDASVPSH